MLRGHIKTHPAMVQFVFIAIIFSRRLQASAAALEALRDAVESAFSDNVGVSTPTVDVFVRENLFPTAISASQERLAVAASSENGLVAWGNTNTQVNEYGMLELGEIVKGDE